MKNSVWGTLSFKEQKEISSRKLGLCLEVEEERAHLSNQSKEQGTAAKERGQGASEQCGDRERKKGGISERKQRAHSAKCKIEVPRIRTKNRLGFWSRGRRQLDGRVKIKQIARG